MGLLKIAFIILIALFPLAELARWQFSSGLSINLNDFLVGVTILIFFFYHLIKKEPIKKGQLMKFIILFPAFGILSLVLNLKLLTGFQFFISSLYALRWTAYAFLFFIIGDFDKKFKKTIIKLLIIVSFIIVLGGFIQYFLYPNLRNLYYLGWDEHLYRMFSSFLDPDFAGAFFSLFFILILGIILNYKNLPRKYFRVLVVFGAITLLAVLFTYSRSAYLTLLIGVCALLILSGKRKLLIFFAGCFVLLTIVFFLTPLKSEGTNLLRTTSEEQRLTSMHKALVIFEKSPVDGFGFDSYRYQQERLSFVKTSPAFVDHAASGTDNSFLFILGTTGIIGLLLYVFTWIKILHQKPFDSVFGKILIASLAGIIIDSFFINSLFYIFIMQWIWILAGLTVNN